MKNAKGRKFIMKRIEVETIFGTLIAEESADERKPGICLSIIENTGENPEVNELAHIEAAPNTPRDGVSSLRLHIWKKKEGIRSRDTFTIKQKLMRD